MARYKCLADAGGLHFGASRYGFIGVMRRPPLLSPGAGVLTFCRVAKARREKLSPLSFMRSSYSSYLHGPVPLEAAHFASFTARRVSSCSICRAAMLPCRAGSGDCGAGNSQPLGVYGCMLIEMSDILPPSAWPMVGGPADD